MRSERNILPEEYTVSARPLNTRMAARLAETTLSGSSVVFSTSERDTASSYPSIRLQRDNTLAAQRRECLKLGFEVVQARVSNLNLAADSKPESVSEVAFARLFGSITENVQRVIMGKGELIRSLLTCLLAEGHVLLQDAPGLGKTTMAKAMARSLGLEFGRVQFTPDLLPSDILGVPIWDNKLNEFKFQPGPVFSGLLLADEINRTSPKTQAALLEAMAERQVTINGVTYPLSKPFLVVATQNSLESEGTFPLPLSQLDRFLMSMQLGYPDQSAELAILDAHGGEDILESLPSVVDAETVEEMIGHARSVYVAAAIKGYMVNLAVGSRSHSGLKYGMSPRATLGLQRCARVRAAAEGRNFVIPDDVKAVFVSAIEHRVMPNSIVSGTRGILEEILNYTPVPQLSRR